MRRQSGPHKHQIGRPRARILRNETLEPRLVWAGDPVISEVVANNTSGLLDENSELSDWLEIHNPGPTPINLAGWHLTDQADAPAKWTLPAVTVPADGYLVVFASGKDRATAGGQLHTNFQIDNDGEYLALVNPAGTVIYAYDPLPNQYRDVSYGIETQTAGTALVGPGATAKVLVPNSAALGMTWTGANEPFADGAWTNGPTGVGFDTTPNNSGPLPPGVLKFDTGAGANGHAYQLVNTSLNFSAARAAAAAITPPAGFQTGHLVTITSAAEQTFVASNFTFVNQTWMGGTDNPSITPGATDGVFRWYTGEPFTYGTIGHSHPWEANNPSNDSGSANDGLTLLPGGGLWNDVNLAISNYPYMVEFDSILRFNPAISTDVGAAMQNQNASALVRIAFNVADPSSFSSLLLRMKYDDGFVAYLNGQEVARRAAPDPVAWNSPSTSDRPKADALQFTDINISGSISALHAGTNVLAIQGLNLSAADADFLLVPQLEATSVLGSQLRYFVTPTPGTANGAGVVDLAQDVTFSVQHGFFDAPFDVTLETPTIDGVIRYTTNGSAPTATNGTLYTGPIHISNTTTLRAATFKTGFQPSSIETQSYIFLGSVLTQNGAGFPTTWNGTTPDYTVDPDVVNNPAYASEIINDLKAIPSLSIVMDVGDLFGPSGIYANPTAEGDAWERPTSAELIYPDGQPGFSVNAGIQVWGSGWRDPGATAKHALRLVFKDQYGAPKLDYPLFPDSEVTSFDTVVLRAQGSRGWTDFRDSINGTQYIHDSWFRDSEAAMGNPTTHATYVHLYLNGLYWGLYNPVERPDSSYAAEHFGGAKEDYDSLDARVGVIKVIDGDQVAWDTAIAIADSGLASAQNYANFKQYVDVQNLINYVLVNVYAGNQDWVGSNANNMRVVRRREPGAGFKFFSWDAEYSFFGVGDNNLSLNAGSNTPAKLFVRALQNPEFKVQLADTIHKQFFNGGALTPEKAAARWMARANEIRGPVVGESARWGDYRREPPYTRNVEWQAELDRLMNTYFPQRTGILLDQFRAAGWYPSVAAPELSPNGGTITPGAKISITPSTGTTYYTTDGSDPRLPGGALAPGAVAYNPTYSTVITSGAAGRVFIPTNGSLDSTWTALTFNDGGWTAGPSNIGYDDGTGTGTAVNIAPLGTASQFSQYNEASFPASAALDGNSGTFTHTDNFANSYWKLDLPGSRNLSKVVLQNRVGCCPERLSNFRVSVLNDAQTEVFGQNYFTPAQGGGNMTDGQQLTINLPAGTVGRTVKVQILGLNNAGNGYLSLSEVQVFGSQSLNDLIGTNLQSQMRAVNASAYLRVPFNIAQAPAVDTLKLKMQYDDGFVAYLNGQEVARRNAPGSVTWNSAAASDRPVAQARVVEEIDISAFVNKLVNGTNVLAIQGLNDNAAGSEFLIIPQLIAGSNASITLGGSARVKARALSGGNWSALADGTFLTVVPPALRITEIMYHPATPPAGSPYLNGDFEYLELQNISALPLQLGNMQIHGGVDFVFPAQTLAPGAHVLVVANQAAFESRYGTGLNIAGVFTDNLSNGGELLALSGPLGEPILNFMYSDAWEPTTDGSGYSLVIVDATAPTATWDVRQSWRASRAIGGSPGLTDPNVSIESRLVFYNNSAFDGDNPAASTADDVAVATDKHALRPGDGTATFANYTNYIRGINGLIVDVGHYAGTIDIGNFSFRVGNDNNLATWTAGPTPTVTVRAGAGVNGSDRVTLIWPDDAIKNAWLETTLTIPGLGAADKFYFGNAIGESGTTGGSTDVNATDEIATRNNPRTFTNPAPADFPFDFNRDGFVNAADQIIARSNATSPTTRLALITLSPSVARAAGESLQSLAAADVGFAIARQQSETGGSAPVSQSLLPASQGHQDSAHDAAIRLLGDTPSLLVTASDLPEPRTEIAGQSGADAWDLAFDSALEAGLASGEDLLTL